MQSQFETSIKDLKIQQQQEIKRCRDQPELLSLNEIYPQSASKCGYCNKEKSAVQWSFTKNTMDPFLYELLMQRGWRRCGTYYYKPNLFKSCCQLFTHRLDVQRFKIKKDQKKTIKKLITLAYEKVQMELEEHNKQKQKIQKSKAQKPKKNDKKEQQIKQQISHKTQQTLQKVTKQVLQFLKFKVPQIIQKVVPNQKLKQFSWQIQGKIRYFISKPAQKCDYYSNLIMLLFGLNKRVFLNTNYNLIEFAKDLKQHVQTLKCDRYKLQVERGGYLLYTKIQKTQEFEILNELQSQKVLSNQKKKSQKSGFTKLIQNIKTKIKGQPQQEMKDLTDKFQHGSSQKFQILKPNQQYKGLFKISSNQILFGKIRIQIVKAQQSQQSYKLYSSYTKDIHEKNQKRMSDYVNFLCLKSLNFRQDKPSTPAHTDYIPSWDPLCKHQPAQKIQGQVRKMMGCYHMKYYLEDKLIAVGVVDIVRSGLSSVYFFYNSAYKEYRLGVFSSLIEIQYIRWLGLSFPEFKYYYMGLYIANCEKMNYKVDYAPCQLLCPETYQFVDFNEQIKEFCLKLCKSQKKPFRLAKNQVKINEDMDFGKNLGPFIDKNLKLMYNGKLLVLKQINPQFFLHILKILKENIQVYGKKVFSILTFTL